MSNMIDIQKSFNKFKRFCTHDVRRMGDVSGARYYGYDGDTVAVEASIQDFAGDKTVTFVASHMVTGETLGRAHYRLSTVQFNKIRDQLDEVIRRAN